MQFAWTLLKWVFAGYMRLSKISITVFFFIFKSSVVSTDEEADGVKRKEGLLNLKFGEIGKTTLVQ